MVHMSPATFGEAQKLVDIYRPSHYLDGPNDVDFVAGIVDELDSRGLASTEASDDEVRRVVEGWTFPLAGLDLRMIEIDAQQLEAERERRMADDYE
jgi:hypothetical protein